YPKNKHAFLDPPGVVDFPAPALHETGVPNPVGASRIGPTHALQNLCRDCAEGCAVHKVRGYSSLIVYKRGLPVRMNFGSKQVAKANSSLRAVSARRANHPDQCLHS